MRMLETAEIAIEVAGIWLMAVRRGTPNVTAPNVSVHVLGT